MSALDADRGHRQGERQFVGAVCASLSHEIKNCLAIINENAGLMEDLALMAGQGRPVDPERQVRIAAAVQKQVRRADRLVGDLNCFAHSGDVDWRELDLADTIAFVAALFERTASKAGRQVSVTTGADLKIETAPMGLLQLLWRLLSIGIEGEAAADGSDADLEVRAEHGAKGVVIRMAPAALKAAPIRLPEALLDLARSLGAELVSTADEGLCLCFPRKPAEDDPGGV